MGFKKTVLDNGVELIYFPVRGIKSVYLGICVSVGSRDETSAQRGISHMFEHILFKGTKRYPDQLAIARAVEMYGGEDCFNAWTSDYGTFYQATIVNNGLDAVMDVLCDMVTVPLFGTRSVNKERHVVLNELRDSHDNPDEMADMEHDKIVYAGTNIAEPTIGSSETIEAMTGRDLRRFHSEKYVPQHFAVIATGDFAPKTFVGLAKKHFGDLKQRKHEPREPIVQAQYTPRQVHISKATEQSHVVMGFPIAPELTRQQVVYWELFAYMLGGNMSSTLYSEIAVRRGLAYSIDAHLEQNPDMSVLKIDFSCEPQHVSRIIQTIQRVVLETVHNRTSFKFAKLSKLAQVTMDYGDAAVMFNQAAKLWPKNRVIYNEKSHKHDIGQSTLAAIRKEVDPYLDFSRWSTVVVGP